MTNTPGIILFSVELHRVSNIYEQGSTISAGPGYMNAFLHSLYTACYISWLEIYLNLLDHPAQQQHLDRDTDRVIDRHIYIPYKSRPLADELRDYSRPKYVRVIPPSVSFTTVTGTLAPVSEGRSNHHHARPTSSDDSDTQLASCAGIFGLSA